MTDEERPEISAAAEKRARAAGFTRDDLNPLAIQVVALREDLAAYRWAIEKILRRRLVTSVVAAVVGVALLVGLGFGVRTFLEQEEARARQTLELARLESCAAVRNLQAQVVGVLTSLPPLEEPRPWLPGAIDRLSVDPCVRSPRP